MPVHSQHLMRYVAHLSQHLAPNSIEKYLNIVRLLHLEYGYDNPIQNWHVQSTIKGIQKEFGTAVKQKLPITPKILLQMKSLIDVTAPYWISFWAASLVAFYGFLRKSNVFYDPHLPPSDQKHIQRRDIIYRKPGITFIMLNHTKTIQFKERTLELPMPSIPNHPLCPVSAITTLLCSVPSIEPDQPAFMYCTPSGLKPLLYSEFIKDLKQLLSKLGYNSKDYSGHSFRRGGATWAMESGLPGEAIQILGDWQSETYRRYIDMNFSKRVGFMNRLSSCLPN